MFDKLVAECTENIDEVKTEEITLTENVSICSYTICVISAVIALAISIGISAYFIYYRWYLKKILLVLSLVPVLNWISLKE